MANKKLCTLTRKLSFVRSKWENLPHGLHRFVATYHIRVSLDGEFWNSGEIDFVGEHESRAEAQKRANHKVDLFPRVEEGVDRNILL